MHNTESSVLCLPTVRGISANRNQGGHFADPLHSAQHRRKWRERGKRPTHQQEKEPGEVVAGKQGTELTSFLRHFLGFFTFP